MAMTSGQSAAGRDQHISMSSNDGFASPTDTTAQSCVAHRNARPSQWGAIQDAAEKRTQATLTFLNG